MNPDLTFDEFVEMFEERVIRVVTYSMELGTGRTEKLALGFYAMERMSNHIQRKLEKSEE